MAYVSTAINYVKDSLIWAADWVEDHPWITLSAVAVLLVLSIRGLI